MFAKETLKYNLSILEKLLIIACSFSILSQLPLFLSNKVIKSTVMLLWIITLLICIYLRRFKIRKEIIGVIACLYIYDFFILFMQLITDKSYLNSNFVYPVNLSIFIFLTAYMVGEGSLNKKHLIERMSKYYVITCLIVGGYIFFDTFRGVNWAESEGYLYTSKNSISQILLIAILLILFCNFNMNKYIKLAFLFCISTILIMLKSRATLIGLLILILYWGLFYIKKRSTKTIFIIVFMMIIFFIFTNQNIYDFIINKIILNNRRGSSLNTISSGRIGHLLIFIENISQNWIVGNGGMYLESFPLSLIISYGILGSIPVFILSLIPLFSCFGRGKNKEILFLRKIVFMTSMIMLINSIFEELSPFGPGVKCFMLWVMYGLYKGFSVKKNNNSI